jgi:hypothetical protein
VFAGQPQISVKQGYFTTDPLTVAGHLALDWEPLWNSKQDLDWESI